MISINAIALVNRGDRFSVQLQKQYHTVSRALIRDLVKVRSQERCDPAVLKDTASHNVSSAKETEGKAFPVCFADDGATAPSPKKVCLARVIVFFTNKK